MIQGATSMKGRVIKKLKSISTITSLKQGFVFRTTNLSERYLQTPPPSAKESDKNSQSEIVGCSSNVPVIIKDDDQEQGQGPGRCQNVKEDAGPSSSSSKLDEVGETPSTDQQIQLSSGSKAAKHPVQSAGPEPLNEKTDESLPENYCRNTEEKDSEEVSALWEEFEEKCPPGGNESIVLYTTSMRGIRKTFEDCNSIRFLLESFRVEYNERDVSLHLEYRDELWKIMESRAVPPRLFIRGRYIGGADEVVGLNERGMLKNLLQGIPLTPSNSSCKGCAGVRFILCVSCNGSRKIITREGQGCDESVAKCWDCNENGLVKCPMCNNFNK